jgi:hypothetical protein
MKASQNHSRLFGLVCSLGTAGLLLAGDGQTRPPRDEQDLAFWLQNMAWHHRYSTAEIAQVTGQTETDVATSLQRLNISDATRPARPADRVFMLPYPGGRHPRIGFLDGAIEPQRETKLSVFCPWDDHSYVVADVPEAIWSNLGLTYLAHTHIDTIWTKQGVAMEPLEWQAIGNGWQLVRRLPNGIEFGTTATALPDHIDFDMWLTNGTAELLSDLRVQNCVMLKGAAGFDQQTNDNKVFSGCYAAAATPDRSRWIITAWEPIHRAWGNAPCPCLHADPKFPDCAPGDTQRLRGWLSFYEGTDIMAELKRIEATGWKTR